MDADDRTGPSQWSTTSPEHLDQLARGVLRAARVAARELRRDPPDPDRQTWALGMLAGQTQAMLGPDLPDHPPFGAEEQEGFVRTAFALAVQVRAHSWSERDLGAAGVPGQEDTAHPGELRSADAFDVLGRLILPHTSSEGWTATFVTDLARGDKTLETAVKLGKYMLHPTFLALTDDATRVVGEALHSINVRRLGELTNALRQYAGAAEPRPLPPRNIRRSVTPLKPARSKRTRLPSVPEGPSTRGAGLVPGPAGSQSPAPPESPRNPHSPRSSEPGSPGIPGPHGFSCSAEPTPSTGPATPSSAADPVSDDSPTEGAFRSFDRDTGPLVIMSGLFPELVAPSGADEPVIDESVVAPVVTPGLHEPGLADGGSRTDGPGFHPRRLRGFGR